MRQIIPKGKEADQQNLAPKFNLNKSNKFYKCSSSKTIITLLEI